MSKKKEHTLENLLEEKAKDQGDAELKVIEGNRRQEQIDFLTCLYPRISVPYRSIIDDSVKDDPVELLAKFSDCYIQAMEVYAQYCEMLDEKRIKMDGGGSILIPPMLDATVNNAGYIYALQQAVNSAWQILRIYGFNDLAATVAHLAHSNISTINRLHAEPKQRGAAKGEAYNETRKICRERAAEKWASNPRIKLSAMGMDIADSLEKKLSPRTVEKYIRDLNPNKRGGDKKKRSV